MRGRASAEVVPFLRRAPPRNCWLASSATMIINYPPDMLAHFAANPEMVPPQLREKLKVQEALNIYTSIGWLILIAAKR